MKIMLFLCALMGLTWLFFEAWEQTCVGIFQDRYTCEVTREYRRDFKICAKQSWVKCEKLNSYENQNVYDRCLDTVRCACMQRLGNGDSCEYF